MNNTKMSEEKTLVNIAERHRLNEPGYRYKREIIRVTCHKKKGTTTTVTNSTAICKQLQCDYENFCKALTTKVKKKYGLSCVGELVFSGKIEAEKIDDILQGMIEKSVLCPQCRLPEWDNRRCKACGYNGIGECKKLKKFSRSPKTDIPEEIPAISSSRSAKTWEIELSTLMDKLFLTQSFSPCQELTEILDRCWVVSTRQDWERFCVENSEIIQKYV